MRLRRWLVRIVLGVLGVAVGLVVVATIFLHTDSGRDWVRRTIVRAAAESFPGGFRIGRLDGSVFGVLVAHDVEIDALDGRPMLRAPVVRIDLGLAALLRKTYRLEVAADDAELFPARPAVRPVLDDPDAEPFGWRVELAGVQLHRARVAIDGAATLDAVELSGSLVVPPLAPLEARAELHATWRERAAPIAARVELHVDRAPVPVPVIDTLEATIGDVIVKGDAIAIDPAHPRGRIHVETTVAAARALAPELALPGAVTIDVTAAPAGAETTLELTGAIAGSPVGGTLRADLAARAVRGVVTASDVDLALVTRGAVTGRGSATVAVAADLGRARGTVIASGEVAGVASRAVTVIGFDAALDASHRITRGTAVVFAAGAGDARARGTVELIADPAGALAIARARVVASTPELGAAIAQRALIPIHGAVTVEATASGPLDAIAVSGRFAGHGLVYTPAEASPLGAQSIDGTFDGALARTGVTGHATAELRGVTRDGELLGTASASARTRGKALWASVTARPAATPIVVVADALVTPGATTEIELASHRVTLPSGEAWTGSGGHVTISDAAIALRGLRSTNRDGRIEVAATYGRLSEDLAIDVDARGVAAAAIRPEYRGTATGTLSLARRREQWTGRASVTGRGLALAADAPAFDGDATLAIDGRRVTLGATAHTASLGRIALSIDADGPRDLTDVAAWRALERSALRSTVIELHRVDLAAAAVPTGGIVDGTLAIAGSSTKGTLSVSALRTPLGDVDGDIQFRPEANSELGATWAAHVVGLGDAEVIARIAFPVHPFDPAAWRTLGRGALSSLSARLADISIDPNKLAALGVTAPYRGTANVAVTVERGSTYAKVEAELAGITGGALVRPIDVVLVAETDGRGTRGSLRAAAPRPGARLELLAIEAGLPVTFERWLAAPRQAIYAPITGKLAVPTLEARDVLALIGRTDVAAGTLGGAAGLGGTLGTPTVDGTFRAHEIAIVDRIEHRTIPKLDELTIRLIWGGITGSVRITGTESGGSDDAPRTLFVSLAGRPTERSSLVGHLDIKHFDLVPIAAFLPGPLVGAQGTLDANLSLRGLDTPETLRGSVELIEARVPLHPSIGTLTGGHATLKITDAGFDAVATGTLGAGGMTLTAKSPGHQLAAVEATLRLARVSPIGDLEPVITGAISGTFSRSPANQWRGHVEVRDASIELPPQSGEALLVAEAPPDLYFLDGGGAPKAPVFVLGGRPPDRPRVIADIEFGQRGRAGIKVKAEDLYDTRGELAGKLRVAVGESVGIDGRIDIVRGDVGDLVGRSYRAEGGLIFDGTTDPTLDITLAHRFPEMVLTAHLSGRLSNPEPPTFGGDPIYTQDQLAGFFLGGEPGGDPAAQTREAATGATASILSSRLGRRVRKALPVKLSLLRCEPGSSAVGASCSAGRWFGDKLFVTGKYRLVARPDENIGEVQVQYYLQRELLLEGVGGDGNHDGVDLLWRRRW